MQALEILMLSPYDGTSHRYWRESLADTLVSRENANITTVTLPARHFSWRQRGNSLSFSAHPDLQRPYDLLIATSMTDLSALRGMNRYLARAPAIVYFHENQFAYPDRGTQGLLERQLTSIYTAVSADSVIFNSDWNRGSFMHGANELLGRMPDGVPLDVMTKVAEKSAVVPVALPAIDMVDDRRVDGPLRIVWNHRFEYDKGPALLLDFVQQMLASNLPFRMSLLGERYRDCPAELQGVVDLLQENELLDHNGFIQDRTDYLQCLSRHDVVLSTSLHEFQGLSVQEALLCGCSPLVPDRLVYPEYVPEPFRYNTAEDAVERLACGLPAYDRALMRGYLAPTVNERWQAIVRDVTS